MPCNKPSTCDCICTLVTLDVSSVTPGAQPIEVKCEPVGTFEGCRCDLSGTADDQTTTVDTWVSDAGILYVEVYYASVYYSGYALGAVCDGAAGAEGKFVAASVTCYSELEEASITVDIGGACFTPSTCNNCDPPLHTTYTVTLSNFVDESGFDDYSFLEGSYLLTESLVTPCWFYSDPIFGPEGSYYEGIEYSIYMAWGNAGDGFRWLVGVYDINYGASPVAVGSFDPCEPTGAWGPAIEGVHTPGPPVTFTVVVTE